MDTLQQLIDLIPIKHDAVSSVILAGVLIGLLVTMIVFIRADSKNQAIRIFGCLLLVELLIGVDGYLCYTGLMKYTLHLNDVTEPLSLTLGPFIYLFTKSIVYKDQLKLKWDGVHFLVPIIYFFTQTIYYFESLGIKYAAYTNAYHPDLESFDQEYSSIFLLSDSIKNHFKWYIIASLGIYLLLSFKVYFSQIKNDSALVQFKEKRHLFSLNLLFLVFVVFLLVLVVFTNFQNDLGDHYIFIFFSFINFVAAAFILSESRFFERSWVSDKYETSGLKGVQENVFGKIDEYVNKNKYYLRSDASLTDLAMQLSMPKNYVSQAVNKESGNNFNDYINTYRVEEVKRRLADEDYQHYNIESIGESVGFNAKTTFYAAFKKHTQQTPAAYLKSL